MSAKREKGFALVGVIIASGLSVLLFGYILSQIQTVTKMVNYIEAKNFMNDAAMKLYVIQANADLWIDALRNSAHTHGVMGQCLLENGSTYSCPEHDAALEANPELVTLIPTSWSTPGIASVPLVDFAGNPLAGTAANPVYFDKMGAVCNPSGNRKCPYSAVSYMIRENRPANGNPGRMIFAYQLRATGEAFTHGINLKPVYAQVVMNNSELENCPPDSTKINNGVVGPGCIANNQHWSDAKNYNTANSECMDSGYDRVASQAEFQAAAAYPSVLNLVGDYEWTSTGLSPPVPDRKLTCGLSSVNDCVSDLIHSFRRFHCWLDL